VTDPRVSIGRVKRDISELVNRVAFGKERIVLTSRGKPKAVIVSLEDYESLRNDELEEQRSGWEAWLAQNRKVAAEILEERNGVPINVDELWEEYRTELEKRHDFLLDN
jgi:prevent-host-death family protein